VCLCVPDAYWWPPHKEYTISGVDAIRQAAGIIPGWSYTTGMVGSYPPPPPPHPDHPIIIWFGGPVVLQRGPLIIPGSAQHSGFLFPEEGGGHC
jgi:hypothetical protein